MFVLIAGPQDQAGQGALMPMADALRHAARPPVSWWDDNDRAGVAASVAGTLPEDVFDRSPLIDERVVFVAQARLDNRPELERALGLSPAEAAMTADTALLFLCYRRWGEECVQHLVGDYAFASWDRQSGRVTAAADCLATVPLFYAEVADGLLMSTQLGALLAHPEAPRTLDLEALAMMPVPKSIGGSTPYRDIRQVPGGHLLSWGDDGLRLRRWWRPDTSILYRRDPRDYVEEAGALLQQAVRATLRTSGSIASTMSGGLDSSLVSAMAAQMLREEGRGITAYTSVPEPGLAVVERPGWDADDFPFAADIAAMHDNMRHVAIAPDGASPLDIVPQTHAFSRTPVRNGANYLWFGKVAAQARAAGGNVLLVGEKGNATSSRYGSESIAMHLRRGQGLAAWRLAAALARGEDRPLWRLLARGVLGTQRIVPDQPGLALLMPAWRARVRPRLASYYQGMDVRGRAIAFLMRPREAWGVDALAQWGVQFRDPLANRRLMECLLRFPPEAFVQDGRFRGLARALGRGVLPDSVRLRHTRGAQVPEHPSLISRDAQRYLAIVESLKQSPQVREIFDLDTLRRLIIGLRDGRMALAEAITVDRIIDCAMFTAAHEAAR
ncbi:asparagine synthetase B family protein [Pseudomonas sp. LRF_L74]|uniref:asparagine synthetase B family protein n=1 Tax=Pseudomonas sp. LRF_L74 TaxID=3369422 RepID=UPI003F5E85CA